MDTQRENSENVSFAELAKRVDGEVRWDRLIRQIYSVDASIYQIEPACVVFPKSRNDVVETIRFAGEHNLTVTARGAATGITGACLGAGIVLDFSRYMNRILEINYQEGYAVVEPGVVQDQLNNAVKDHRYRFGPDTSTGNRATIGGMFGNNSSGAHSLYYGKTSDNVLEVETVLADGRVVSFGEGACDGDREFAPLLAELTAPVKDEIARRYPKIQRNVSGYALDLLTAAEGGSKLARFLCGSEGTLAIATRFKVKIVPMPVVTALVVLHFKDMIAGLRSVPWILESKPYSLELIDDRLLRLGRENPAFTGELKWLKGEPQMILVVEFESDDRAGLEAKVDAFCREAEKRCGSDALTRVFESSGMAEIWQLRKAGLGIIMSQRTPEKALAFLEDTAVPPEKLSEYMERFQQMLTRCGKEAAYYGHAGVGLIHIRPLLNLADRQEAELMTQMMQEITGVLLEYGGSLSGEHGDGLIRSWLIEKMYGPRIYEVFRKVKNLFDPQHLLNPGKIVDPPQPLQDLRRNLTTQRYRAPFPTMFDFDRRHGGFTFAAGMCNGNATCRQIKGNMCPSFQVSGEEEHSTRARATAICQALLSEDASREFVSHELYRTLELCVQCKACQTDCPSQVDIARMKSEFLYHYQQVHGVPLRNRIFANIDTLNRLGSLTPRLSNAINNSAVVKKLFEAIGITSRRKFPAFARERFSQWYRREKASFPEHADGDKVALFVDTFAEFNYPEIAQAAFRVLYKLGCRIAVAPYTCCGRPAISKGLLKDARAKAERLAALYLPYVEQGYRIVGLEPSCIATLQDEYRDLLPGDVGDRIAAAAMSTEEYLYHRLRKGTFDLDWEDAHDRHVHIHV
ncbi:MAG: FAD-binding oxidoreductase, partial [Lentisphaerae bacterium]